jgi:hypothetical protein
MEDFTIHPQRSSPPWTPVPLTDDRTFGDPHVVTDAVHAAFLQTRTTTCPSTSTHALAV